MLSRRIFLREERGEPHSQQINWYLFPSNFKYLSVCRNRSSVSRFACLNWISNSLTQSLRFCAHLIPNSGKSEFHIFIKKKHICLENKKSCDPSQLPKAQLFSQVFLFFHFVAQCTQHGSVLFHIPFWWDRDGMFITAACVKLQHYKAYNFLVWVFITLHWFISQLYPKSMPKKEWCSLWKDMK